jgi:hypothetical protein
VLQQFVGSARLLGHFRSLSRRGRAAYALSQGMGGASDSLLLRLNRALDGCLRKHGCPLWLS